MSQKELLKPDPSTAESVIKWVIYENITDTRFRQKWHGPTLTASRTHCAVYHMSRHKMRRTPNESHTFFYCQSDYTARPRHRLKTLITDLRLGRRLCPTCWCNCFRNIPTSCGPSPPSPGAGLTYRGLIGSQQGRMLSFHACFRKGGGARLAVQLLPSFCHIPVGSTQGLIQMYQEPGFPTIKSIIVLEITWTK